MTRLATSWEFGSELVEALGLKGQLVESITIRVKAGELAQARVTTHLREEAGLEFVRVTRRYRLVPQE
jgi:hypothetical protein